MAERAHRHHGVAKSRGGPDEDWNFIDLDPYTHAYEHAVDFVLFEHAPVFDCRHEAWPLLPLDLQDLVREKLRDLWNSRQSGKGKKGGAACVDKQVGICAPDYGEIVSQNMQNLVDKGKHWFQANEHSARVSLENAKKFTEGTHPLQQPGECPVCGVKLKTKSGLGPHMRKHLNAK